VGQGEKETEVTPRPKIAGVPRADYLVRRSMSVIVRTFTPEGFVIAADGLDTGAENGAVLTKDAQKIFPIESPCGSFAASICGAARIADDAQRDIAVDINAELIKSFNSLRHRKTRNLLGYANRLAPPIYTAMRSAVESGLIRSYPTLFDSVVGERGSTITRIMLDGDDGGHPSSVTIRFFHENGVLAEPEIQPQELLCGMHRAYGSDVIAQIIFGPDDERLAIHKGTRMFETYRVPWLFADEVNLQNAVERSNRYIEACSDPEAASMDPFCARMGGHIHIATVTPREGFQWVSGYEPIGVG
jgi:hypothetical protein